MNTHTTRSIDTGADGCPSLAELALLLDAGAAEHPNPPPTTAAAAGHVRSCSICRHRLAEMIEHERFIVGLVGGDSDKASDADTPVHGDEPRDDFPGYAVESVLAVGGQGVVYRARQVATGRRVAIKVPIGDAVRKPSTRYRLRREIELTARLDHPNIVRVLGDCVAADGRVGCVMELVDGQRFDDWAARQRTLGTEGRIRIVDAVRAVAGAIAYAHQRGVLHRDLKPGNVLVADDGSPRVLDFGLAKALDLGTDSYVTVTGAFLGTLAHAAPEQVDGGEARTDIRTDVHGIGLLLYTGLTGALPWNPHVPTPALVSAIREGSLRRPTDIAPPRDEALDAIVLKAIAKATDRRYETASDLAADLARWKEGAPVRARFDSRVYVLKTLAWRHRFGLATAVAIALALVLLSALWIGGRAAALRAEFAHQLREAGVAEAHWATVADARSIARDNFFTGERRLWDLLLAPDPALIDRELEGPSALGPNAPSATAIPTSPTYWALWEAYTRTPVVASVPSLTVGLTPAPDELGRIWTLDGNGLHLWDWKRGVCVRSIALPDWIDGRATALQHARRWMLLQAATGDTALVDLDRDAIVASWISTTRLRDSRELGSSSVLCAFSRDPDGATVELLDLSVDPPAVRWIRELPSEVIRAVIDEEADVVTVLDDARVMRVLDLGDGRELLTSRDGQLDGLVEIRTRGVPGEVILCGQASYAIVDTMARPVTIGPIGRWSDGAAGIYTHRVPVISPAPGSRRRAVVTGHQQLGIADHDAAIDGVTLIPAVRCQAAFLLPDGRHISIHAYGGPRYAIVALEHRAVIRLDHPAAVPIEWRGTVFDCAFTPDSTALLTVAVDGSARRYDLPAGVGSSGDPAATDTTGDHVRSTGGWMPMIDGTIIGLVDPTGGGGLTRLAVDGDDLLVGTHAVHKRDARVLRLRGDTKQTLQHGEREWICGLVVEPEEASWSLTGDGVLRRHDMVDGTSSVTVQLPRHAVASHRALVRLARRRLLLVGPSGAGMRLLDERTLREVAPAVRMESFRHIAVNPADEGMIATTHESGTVRVWRLVDGSVSDPTVPPLRLELLLEFDGHAGPVYCAAFHPSGRILATGAGVPEQRDIRLWDIERGRELASLGLFDAGVFCVAFSPDGRWLAAGGEPREGERGNRAQLYLIDLTAAEASIAGHLEYHLQRWTAQHGGESTKAALLRTRFPRAVVTETADQRSSALRVRDHAHSAEATADRSSNGPRANASDASLPSPIR